MSGASPRSARTRAPSSVADMTRSRRSSRRAPCASSASASPRSASSERSWNSSNSTAATPSSAGSSRIMRVNTPSVTTSMRVRAETRLCRRTRRPIVSPTFSPSVAAMRAAAARGGEPARLEQQQALLRRPGLVEQGERRARRLAGAGRRDEHGARMRSRARRAARRARRRSAEARRGRSFALPSQP